MSRPKSIGGPLAELALEIAQEVQGSDDIKMKIEAFRHLTAYYVSTARASKHLPEEEEQDSIIHLKERISKSTTKRAG